MTLNAKTILTIAAIALAAVIVGKKLPVIGPML